MTQTTVTRIYKPLHELKYTYASRSKPTTVEAEASAALLPAIRRVKSRDREDGHHATQNHRCATTVKHILRMKLECGHLHDQISLIELHMKEEEAKHREATSEHERFAKAFAGFLGRQYKRVKGALAELATHEQRSARTQATLEQLEQRVIEKSLRIYELERRWRRYKVSQNFLLHVASLLKHDDDERPGALPTFNVDPPCDTPSLDELVRNFETHSQGDLVFCGEHFEHVTAERVRVYLRTLRKQNLRLLDLKLRYAETKEDLEEEKRRVERECDDREGRAEADINEIRRGIDDTIAETEQARTELEVAATSAQREDKSARVSDFESGVEMLYKRCFGSSGIEGSHSQMMKCVEEHCVMLLNKLSMFDSQTLKKVAR